MLNNYRNKFPLVVPVFKYHWNVYGLKNVEVWCAVDDSVNDIHDKSVRSKTGGTSFKASKHSQNEEDCSKST